MASHTSIPLLLLALFTLLFSATASAQQDAGSHKIIEAMPATFCVHEQSSTTTLCEQARRQFQGAQFIDAAKTWENTADALRKLADTERPQGLSERAFDEHVDMLILAAHAWEKAEDFSRAGLSYHKSAKLNDKLKDYLNFKAAQNLVRAPNPPHDLLLSLLKKSALEHGFAGSELVAAQIDALSQDGLPSPEHLERALSSSTREDTCEWISTQILANPRHPSIEKNRDLAYGYCLPDEMADAFENLSFTPSPPMRLGRAGRWFLAVRFKNAEAEFAALSTEKLDAVDRCHADFLLGRTLFRLKKRTEALQQYEKVANNCTDPKNEDDRVRALYAAGDTLYWRSRFADSKRYFETLLNDYPGRTHADDAILYLARIARKTNDPAREKTLVQRALADYPDGDMLHEIVWEYTESAVRADQHQKFLDTLSKLQMPDSDAEYFSQGRLEYFAARAHLELGQKARAFSVWQKNWQTYPFSFYGYLSRERLVEAKQTPEPLQNDAHMNAVDWFVDPAWRHSASAQLASLGLYQMAADAEQARQTNSAPDNPITDTDRWRLAALEHLAGRFPVSHNIARRQITGRPWALPPQGSLARWQIGWPNPFESDISRAVVAERRQANPGVLIEPALPAAIMREESSFIEDIESYAGALGLMQLMPATAGDHDSDIPGGSNHENLKTSLVNIRIGVDHLFSLARRFKNHPVLIAAAYNAGGGAVNSWLRKYPTQDIGLWVEDIPYDQTRNYTKRVIGSYAAYQWLSGIYDLDPTVINKP